MLSFPAEYEKQVKHACEVLARAAGGTVSWKITDHANTTLHAFDARAARPSWVDRVAAAADAAATTE